MRSALQVTGVLGILIAAKRRKLIQEVKPSLDVGFWVDERLYAEVLQTVGE